MKITALISTTFMTVILFSSPVAVASGDDVPLDEYSAYSIFHPGEEMSGKSADRINYSIEPVSEPDTEIFPVYKNGQQ